MRCAAVTVSMVHLLACRQNECVFISVSFKVQLNFFEIGVQISRRHATPPSKSGDAFGSISK